MYLQFIKCKSGGEKKGKEEKNVQMVFRGISARKICCYKTACNDVNIQAENTPFSPLCNKIINKLYDDTCYRPSSGPPVLWSGPIS